MLCNTGAALVEVFQRDSPAQTYLQILPAGHIAHRSPIMTGEKSRGEIGEIRTQLNALSASGGRPEAAIAKKELFKKVINCMTIGIDMSSLFMQVMTAGMSNAEDVVLKKMLYLFICTYAQSNPDLTLLTINLLTKDCKDQDPTIRGLALRSLCSLRVANLIEYIVRTVTPL